MKRRRVSILRWSVGVGILLFLLAGIDGGATITRLERADLRLAAVGIAGLSAMHLIGALTWRIMCVRTGLQPLPWRASVTVYYASQALGAITPANLGGDGYRVYALRAGGRGLEESIRPVVLQRATSYVALGVLAAAALPALASAAPAAIGIVAAALGACVIVAIAGLSLLAPRGWLRRMGLRLFGSEASAVSATAMSTRSLAGLIGVGIVLGLGFHAGSILLTSVLVMAVAPGSLSIQVLAALALARLAIAVPITPSGIGVQEGLLALFFADLGQPAGVAIAAMLFARLALVATGALGIAALIADRRQVANEGYVGHRRPRDQSGRCLGAERR